jgi:hypothetical protein
MTTKHNVSRRRKAIDRLLAAAGHLFIIALACSISGSFAQEAAPEKKPKVPFERFAGGIRMGVAFTNTIRGGNGQEFINNIDPFTGFLESVTTITAGASAPTKRFAWGPTFLVNFTPKIGINLEFMTRTFSYETSVGTDVEGPDSVSFLGSQFERANGRYWDLPILMRYFLTNPRAGARPYLTGGLVMRRVTELKGILETISPEDLEADTSQFTDITPAPANETAAGAVAGIGVNLVDDFGVKLEIEGRFTRFLQRSIATGLANSNQNQAEILVGITF